MTTLDLGKIKLQWQGEWVGGTAYEVDDVVLYDGSSYICILNTTGNQPDLSPTYWEVMTLGVTDVQKIFIDTLEAGSIQSIDPRKKIASLPTVHQSTGGAPLTSYLMASNEVMTCGNGTYNGINYTKPTPNVVAFEADSKPTITELFQGHFCLYVLDDNGKVWSMGLNSNGQLGHGNTTTLKIFKKIQYFEDQSLNITKIIPTQNHQTTSREGCYFLTDAGHVYYTGYNGQGQAGIGNTTQQTTPVRCGTLTDIVDVATTQYSVSAYAWSSTGSLWAWGYNAQGQLGIGNTTQQTSPVLTSASNVIDVKCCFGFSSATTNTAGFAIATLNDGTLLSTGSNYVGQLGQGDTTQRTTWTAISGLTNISKVAVAQGYYGIVAALESNGTLHMWGASTDGIRGSNLGNRTIPYELSEPWQGSVDDIKLNGYYNNAAMLVKVGNKIYVSGYFSVGISSDDNTSPVNEFRQARGINGTLTDLLLLSHTTNTNFCWVARYTDGHGSAVGSNVGSRLGVDQTAEANVHILQDIKF